MNTKPLHTCGRRILVLLSALFCQVLSAQAQTANQYTAAFSSSATLLTQTSPTTLLSAPNDDNVATTAQAIGFNFSYEGVVYTHFVASPDGFIKLVTSSSGTGTDQFSNSITSTTNVPKLMVLWDDLALGSSAGGGYVKYSLEGSAPNLKAVIEWFVTIPRTTSGAANTKFQAVLNQSGNTIDFIYGGTPAGSPSSASAGLGGATASNYLSVTFTSSSTSSTTANNSISAYPTVGTKITFTPPVLCSGAPTPGTASVSLNPVCPGGSTTLSLTGTTVAAGIGIQWQSSTDNISFTSISGATGSTYVATPASSTVYYKAVVTCSSLNPVSSNTLTVTSGPSTLPFAEQFNTYLPNTCWSEATGQLTASATLSGTSSGWTGPTNYLNGTTTNPAARINNYSNTKREWFTTPPINLGTNTATTSTVLEFNAGFVTWTTTTPTTMGSDDTVAVVISTDAGLTWSKSNIVQLFTAANTPLNTTTGGQRFFIPLDGYSGVIKIGFYSSEGTVDDAPDYDVFIDSILVRTCARPTVALGNDTTICPAATITLNAGNAGSTFLYSNNATTQSIAVTSAGTYSVRVVNPTGCTGRDTIVIAAASNPVVALGNDTTICPAATITLNAGNPGSSYLYSNSATTQTTNITAAGTYNVRVTNPQGCIGRDTIVIAQGVNPVVNLGNDTVICPAATITLNAGNPGSTYLFSNSATTQTINVMAAGTYSVRVTNVNKCVGRDTIVLTAGVNPVVNLGADTFLCPGDTIRLNAGNPGSTYLYSNAVTTQIANITLAGSYNVRVTNAQKCVGRDTIVIGAGVNPVVNLGNDTTFCPGATITLNAGNPGSQYLYSTSATTQTITVSTAGTYSVRVTNPITGCKGRDTIVIFAGSNPVVNLGNDTVLCPGATITLNAGNPGSSYLYNTSATTQTLAVNTSGTYSVRVTNVNKCVGRDTIVITPGVSPIVNLGPDTSVCYGTAFTIDAGNPGSSYLYSTGATTRTLSVIPTGAYSVIVTNSQKCVGYDTIVVTAIPLASANYITQSKNGSTVTFGSDAVNTTSYLWSFGDGTTSNAAAPVHSYVSNGVYTVRLLVINQCAVDTVTTTVTISGVSAGNISLSSEELLLYPNPAAGNVYVVNKSRLQMQSVTVLNTLGAAVILREGIDPKEAKIDLSALPAGTYMVRIQTDGGAFLRKLQVLQ